MDFLWWQGYYFSSSCELEGWDHPDLDGCQGPASFGLTGCHWAPRWWRIGKFYLVTKFVYILTLYTAVYILILAILISSILLDQTYIVLVCQFHLTVLAVSHMAVPSIRDSLKPYNLGMVSWCAFWPPWIEPSPVGAYNPSWIHQWDEGRQGLTGQNWGDWPKMYWYFAYLDQDYIVDFCGEKLWSSIPWWWCKNWQVVLSQHWRPGRLLHGSNRLKPWSLAEYHLEKRPNWPNKRSKLCGGGPHPRPQCCEWPTAHHLCERHNLWANV